MGSIFSAIGRGINAIVSAIAGVIMAIVGAITTRRVQTLSPERWNGRRSQILDAPLTKPNHHTLLYNTYDHLTFSEEFGSWDERFRRDFPMIEKLHSKGETGDVQTAKAVGHLIGKWGMSMFGMAYPAGETATMGIQAQEVPCEPGYHISGNAQQIELRLIIANGGPPIRGGGELRALRVNLPTNEIEPCQLHYTSSGETMGFVNSPCNSQSRGLFPVCEVGGGKARLPVTRVAHPDCRGPILAFVGSEELAI
ncbi:hypothetical protein B0H17DRAFT_1135290 [Mycena rosella]|uniref:Uncharacterized protein n=1 Tax=Mycena rosella TaxID=1033263 RepID=A0AAD7GI27_MYCRO|nr:hypothetical protein B0H17DRAFT_1135290 [Mycena rosella]